MRKWRECIEKIEDEIEELVEHEAEEITEEGQQRLHFFLENRKHLMECLAEKQAAHGVAGR